VDHLQLQQSLIDLDIVPEFPELCWDIVYDEFSGLTLQEGIYCNECPKVMGTMGSASTHYSTAHSGIKKPKDLPIGHYQQLNRGLDRVLFRVIPRSRHATSSDEMLVATLRAETDKAFTEAIQNSNLNARAVTPWLLSTKWHLHIDGYDPRELMALVKPLSTREDSRLVDLVHQYYDDATDLIDHTDELTLQHLNTPDPTKTYVNFNWFIFM
jgi:hypothetical protein